MTADAWRPWRAPVLEEHWHTLFTTIAFDYLTPARLASLCDYAEAMYLATGNPLYAVRAWIACRHLDVPPPEWVLLHVDEVFARAWLPLESPGRTPTADEIADAFGLGPGSRHYAALANPRGALIGFKVLQAIRMGVDPKVESAIKHAAHYFKLSEREVWRIYAWYKSLPGISPGTS
jgi:hypothetical protein